MRFILKTRYYGVFSFWANERDGSSYIYLEDTGIGTNGTQICEGGKYRGNTLTCRGNPEDLQRVARKWYRDFYRNQISNRHI